MSSAEIHAWADAARRFADEWPERGARVAALELERAVATDTGGDGRLRNHPSGAATVSVDAGSGEATVMADGSGAVWAILEYGTSAHEIHAKPGRYLLTPMGPRRFVRVSGVAPRRTWTVGAAVAMAEAEREADIAFGEL